MYGIFTYLNGWFLWKTLGKYTYRSSHGMGLVQGPNSSLKDRINACQQKSRQQRQSGSGKSLLTCLCFCFCGKWWCENINVGNQNVEKSPNFWQTKPRKNHNDGCLLLFDSLRLTQIGEHVCLWVKEIIHQIEWQTEPRKKKTSYLCFLSIMLVFPKGILITYNGIL